jgi:hypothetical protein
MYLEPRNDRGTYAQNEEWSLGDETGFERNFVTGQVDERGGLRDAFA